MSQPLILFGAGGLGRYVLAGLRKVGIEPVAFADNNPTLWGTEVDGLAILCPNDAITIYHNSAKFIITIYQPSPVRATLQTASCETEHVAKTFWRYPEVFGPECGFVDPSIIASSRPQIEACWEILADDQSKVELMDQVQWRATLGDSTLAKPSDIKNIYFDPSVIKPNPNEVFVDCGAFTGDTIHSFVDHWGQFRYIYAIEPDKSSYNKLVNSLNGLSSRVEVMPFALSNTDSYVTFAQTGTPGSKFMVEANSTVECKRLDSIQWYFRPTFVKMDIEGAEPKAIAGGAQLLREKAPALAICTYHRSEHLWQIPLILHNINPDYKLYLRRYAEDCWETVCYAIPPGRELAVQSLAKSNSESLDDYAWKRLAGKQT